MPQDLPQNTSIRAYYEQNTAWFRLVGQRRQNLAIHRPVWAEGIADRQAALNYVNTCIAKQVQAIATRTDGARVHLLDLGCGFGGTLHYLLRHCETPLWATGVTISAQQAHAARQSLHALGAADNSALIEADFHAIPLPTAGMDVVCSIEAFAHAHAPARYFAEVARVLKPGGRLILCDDFRVDGNVDGNMDRNMNGANETSRRWLALFQTGWRVPHLLAHQQVTSLAQQYGLHKIEARDFNPYLRMRTFPNRVLPLFEQMVENGGRISPLIGSIVGGWALEHCIRQQSVTYRFLVYEKQA